MPEKSEPVKRAPAKAKPPTKPPLPTHKDDLAALAIQRGIPSYIAWHMTVDELTDELKES